MRKLAAARHRIAGVDRQVDEHLLDLPGIGAHASQRRIAVVGEIDVLADQAPQHPLRAGDDLIEREHLRRQHLTAAERRAADASGPPRGRPP